MSSSKVSYFSFSDDTDRAIWSNNRDQIGEKLVKASKNASAYLRALLFYTLLTAIGGYVLCAKAFNGDLSKWTVGTFIALVVGFIIVLIYTLRSQVEQFTLRIALSQSTDD